MKYVVKLGGAGLETPSLLAGCVRAITDLVRDGHQVAVVHGGGVQLTPHFESSRQAERIHRRPPRDRRRNPGHRTDGLCRQSEQEPGGR